MKKRPRDRRPGGRIVAEYDYRDAAGKLRFQVVRHDPKGFAVRRPDGRGGWKWFGPGSPPTTGLVLYRLPELLAAPASATVFIVEGEKDVERLRAVGLVATCNPLGGGKGKWRTSYGKALVGRKVALIPDNDATGAQHMRDVARKLVKRAAEVRVLTLRGLPGKGDVSDWLALPGNTPTELIRLAAEAPIAARVEPPELKQGYEEDRERNERASMDNGIIQSSLTTAEKLVLLVAARLTGPVTQETLAAAASLTPRRLRDVIGGLASRGLLSVRRGSGGGSYWVSQYGLSRR